MIGRWTVLNGVLLAIVVLLGVQTTWTWMRSVPPLRVPEATGAVEPGARRDTKVKRAPERAEQAADAVNVITSMDLFDATRQAVGTAVAGPAVEVPPPTGIELVGIRLLSGDEEAFIRDASQQNAQRRVRTGDEVAGYTVQAINPTNLELGNAAGQTVTLWLQLAQSGAAKPPGAPGALRPGAPVPPRAAGAVAGQQGAAAPPLDPGAAERQRQRLQRLQRQRNGAAVPPALPGGVQQLSERMKGA